MAVPLSPTRRMLLRTLPALALLAMVARGDAQVQLTFDDPGEARRALSEAQAQGEAARLRAETLEASASQAQAAADKTAQEAAAIAARIQQAEARIAGNEARIALLNRQRAILRQQLAQRQRPVVQLTAALQRLSRRPPVLSLVSRGTLQDTIYLRAVLDTMLPEVARRTAALRAEIARSRALQDQIRRASQDLRSGQTELNQRRAALAALESRQRLASRDATGVADREGERALALAEQARDLTALVDQLDQAGALRERLAQLPGPVPRPPRPADSQVSAAPDPAVAPLTGLGRYLLPVAGRLVAGFGDVTAAGVRSRGLTIAARAGAQAVTPAPGRVAFAGPYPGYGSIVIIEHGGGWTSLITGLAQLDVAVGERLVSGSPLGVAGSGSPVVSVELRRAGQPVNPLDAIRGG